MSTSPFFEESERAWTESFLRQGYVIVPASDSDSLSRIQSRAASLAAGFLDLPAPKNPEAFLDRIHDNLSVDRLNDLRLNVIQGLTR